MMPQISDNLKRDLLSLLAEMKKAKLNPSLNRQAWELYKDLSRDEPAHATAKLEIET